jgi:hypothetical protein
VEGSVSSGGEGARTAFMKEELLISGLERKRKINRTRP